MPGEALQALPHPGSGRDQRGRYGGHPRKGLGSRTPPRAHLCRDKLSRDVAENILVRQVAASLCEWHDLAPRLLKLKDSKVSAEGIAGDFAARPPRLFGHAIELSLEVRIEPESK